MVEVKVIEQKEIDYPKLMISIHSPCIVLFIDDSIGFVVMGSNAYDLGQYYDCWKMEEFIPFNGELILKNK